MEIKKFSEQEKNKFYDDYFTQDDITSYRYDVGACATRKAIISKITQQGGAVLEVGTGISSVLFDLQDTFKNKHAFKCSGIDILQQTIARVAHLCNQLGKQVAFLVADAESLTR